MLTKLQEYYFIKFLINLILSLTFFRFCLGKGRCGRIQVAVRQDQQNGRIWRNACLSCTGSSTGRQRLVPHRTELYVVIYFVDNIV